MNQARLAHPLLNQNMKGTQCLGWGFSDVMDAVFAPVLVPLQLTPGAAATVATPISDVFSAVPGLGPVAQDILRATVASISELVGSIEAVTKFAAGEVNWSSVTESLGRSVRAVSDVMVTTNLNRIMANAALSSPISSHAFQELDRFTGGFVSSGVNVSDLVYRAGRGDPISKQELARDAIFALQVVSIAFGGGAAVGGIVGGWTGSEVCKHQTEHQDTCKAAFIILGSASGSAIQEALASQAEEVMEKTFLDYLTDTAQKTFTSKIVDSGTKVAVALCTNNQWAGPKECAILGKIAADYVKFGKDQDWVEFLGKEAGRLGVELLMEQAFPPNSKERARLKKQREIKDIHDKGPNFPTSGLDIPYQGEGNPLAILAIAGGIAAAMIKA